MIDRSKKSSTSKYILFDTNAIYNDLTLKSERIESLLRHARLTNSKILLPSILREEVFKQYRADWLEAKRSLEKINTKFNELVEVKHLEDEAMKIFSDSWDDFTNNPAVIAIDSSALSLKEIIDRSIDERKPFGEHSRGFRDALLWMSALSYLSNQTDANDFVLITNNNKDFGKGALIEELASEIKATNREALYYSNLPVFLTEHTSVANLINGRWIERIVEAKVIDEVIDVLVEEWEEEIFEEAYLKMDDSVWEKLLVEDEYHNEDIIVDDYDIHDYYVYGEDKDNYLVQLQITVLCYAIIALATDADYDGLQYEKHSVRVNKTTALNVRVSKSTGKTIII